MRCSVRVQSLIQSGCSFGGRLRLAAISCRLACKLCVELLAAQVRARWCIHSATVTIHQTAWTCCRIDGENMRIRSLE